ncbi:MAG: nitrite transporter NirC [Nitrospinae bacterium RIFCSPLOWO2_12_FULL_47_7]|nr:MAG: nitrite transporter NirC [Nitrospinae bacterium RIFCSPLOWO2_12_FULL_47_7]
MYADDIKKMLGMAEKKIDYMRKSPIGYLLLSALAGVYVGFGIVLIFAIGGPLAKAGSPLLKLIMGASFGIALSLVIFAGSELFTGNNMVFAVGRLSKRVGIKPIIVLFALCYVGNLAGSLALAWMVVHGGSLIESSKDLILNVSAMKMSLPPGDLFLRGLLCNWLVCLAVWTSGRTQNDAAKLIMVFWCLFAFISSGFEHSIANMTLLGMALFFPHGPEISYAGFFYNLLWVTLGNFVGGGIMVGTIYWFAATDPEDKVIA